MFNFDFFFRQINEVHIKDSIDGIQEGIKWKAR